MSPFSLQKTPGVYITDPDAIPRSVVGVETAVPAFIGYTEKATLSGKSVIKKPVKINSLADYNAVFGGPFKYLISIEKVDDPKSAEFDFWIDTPTGKSHYKLSQSKKSRFNLYDSLRLFYANGGGTCYIVSVGFYIGTDPTKPEISGVDIKVGDLLEGLDVIEEEVGPTMLVVPDAVLLPSDDPNGVGPQKSAAFADLTKKMLEKCQKRKDRVAILDVYGTQDIRPATATSHQADVTTVVDNFHDAVGTENLSYGIAYFPFLQTSIVATSDMDYTNYNVQGAASTPRGEDGWNALTELLTAQAEVLYAGPEAAATRTKVMDLIASIPKQPYGDPTKSASTVQLNQFLTNALPILKQMAQIITEKINVLPPSGALAGIYTQIDNSRGVWNAPANVALTSVIAPTFNISNNQQAELIVPINGKAINTIRVFAGRGTLVWGARTLDGTSNDWRHIQVRRTLIHIEQSIKMALDTFACAANDAKTWAAATLMATNFLQGLWRRGGLLGARPKEAFAVECGLGSTMTALDILEGYMIVRITLQMIRPAEFTELTFKQKVQGGG